MYVMVVYMQQKSVDGMEATVLPFGADIHCAMLINLSVLAMVYVTLNFTTMNAVGTEMIALVSCYCIQNELLITLIG